MIKIQNEEIKYAKENDQTIGAINKIIKIDSATKIKLYIVKYYLIFIIKSLNG